MTQRARVRHGSSSLVSLKKADVPWSVRAAATLPRGVAVSNPLLGEDATDTIAVIDTAAREGFTVEDAIALAKNARGALIVADELSAVDPIALHAHGFRVFKIEGCPLTFAASYPLPTAPWLRVEKGGDVEIPEGALNPEQHSGFRHVRTKTEQTVIVDEVHFIEKSANVIKDEAGAEERYILGVVLEPDEIDSQGDTIAAPEIRKAAHKYLESYGNVGLQHQVFVNDKVKILESYVAPVNFTIGDQLVKAGTWLMGFRVIDDSIWNAVKSGTLTGLSIGGTGVRSPVA